MKFISECNLSFNIVQHDAFRELLESTTGQKVQIPTTYEIQKTLIEHSDKIKESLIEKISKQKHVCITCDIWSSRAQSYICMTLHFINTEFIRESYVLALRQMHKSQTYKEITCLIRQVLREYKINPKKVTHIVTDGGSAFCKAFKIFGRGVDLLVTPATDNSVGLDDDNDDDVDDMPFIQSEAGDEFFSNIIDLNGDQNFEMNQLDEFQDNLDEFSNEEGYNEIDNYENGNCEIIEPNNASNNDADEYETEALPAQRRCLSHLLNLIGSDFEEMLTGRPKEAFVHALSKLQAVWMFPRKSSKAKSICKEVLGSLLRIPCITRWNSKFDAVEKVFSFGIEKINAYIEKLKVNLKNSEHLNKLEKEDWIMLGIYIKVMKPIAVSLDRLQGEKDCGQGFILPTLFTMKHELTQLDGGNIMKACRDAMLAAVDKRFKHYFKICHSNSELLLAAASNPRFKFDFIESDSDCDMIMRMMILDCKSLEEEPQLSEITNEDENNSIPNDFFISFSNRRGTRRKSAEIMIEDEINRYFEDERKNYTMLNDYPRIKNLFFKHNTTLSASAAVERVFSQCQIIFAPRRNRLSENNFERLLLVKHNKHVLK